MRAAKVQASLRIRAVSPEPPLLAHTSSESRGTFRQKTRSLALLNGWTCAVKICHDGMLEDTNSLDGTQIINQPQRREAFLLVGMKWLPLKLTLMKRIFCCKVAATLQKDYSKQKVCRKKIYDFAGHRH